LTVRRAVIEYLQEVRLTVYLRSRGGRTPPPGAERVTRCYASRRCLASGPVTRGSVPIWLVATAAL